jgi:hypothetical protein
MDHIRSGRSQQSRCTDVVPHLAGVFYEEAEAWLEEDNMPSLLAKGQGYDSDLDSDDDGRRLYTKVSAQADPHQTIGKKVRKARKKKKAADEKEERRVQAKKAQKAAKKKAQKSGSHGKKPRSKRQREDDTLDDSDSESDSTDSELFSSSSSSSDPSGVSDSSTEAIIPNHHHHHGRKSKSRPSSKTKVNRETKADKDEFSKYQQADPQQVYGMSIDGLKIDEEVAPNSMRPSDCGLMYTAAVDVTSLPGGWNANKGGFRGNVSGVTKDSAADIDNLGLYQQAQGHGNTGYIMELHDLPPHGQA